MARIRTIKPDFFRHAGLFDLEQETGLPVRLAFAGLWTAADREGRFRWQPRELKLDCLPHDAVDFSRVLDALATRGHIVKYRVGDAWFGHIPSWNQHQCVNNRESKSALPGPEEDPSQSTTSTREPRVNDACGTRLDHAPVEGKGREGKGRGRDIATTPRGAVAATGPLWTAYSEAYRARYLADPVRNAKVNGQLSSLLGRLGAEEAPKVAAFYVRHEEAGYVRCMHSVDMLLKDAEKLRTQWATGKTLSHPEPAHVRARREQIHAMTGGLASVKPHQQPKPEIVDVVATAVG